MYSFFVPSQHKSSIVKLLLKILILLSLMWRYSVEVQIYRYLSQSAHHCALLAHQIPLTLPFLFLLTRTLHPDSFTNVVSLK